MFIILACHYFIIFVDKNYHILIYLRILTLLGKTSTVTATVPYVVLNTMNTSTSELCETAVIKFMLFP